MMSSLAVLLAACGTANEANTTADGETKTSKMVEITDAHGTIKVPVAEDNFV